MNYTVRKVFSFFPSLLLMIMIFFFSSQPAEDSSNISESFTYNIVRTFHLVTDSDYIEETLLQQTERLHGVVRKAAHMTEYFLLACSLSFFFYINGFSFQNYFLYTLLICILYAVSDEFHQLFVPGRSCQIRDVLIDTSGCLVYFLFHLILFKLIYFHKKTAH